MPVKRICRALLCGMNNSDVESSCMPYGRTITQKKKGAKKGKVDAKKELMSKLNDDEKNDLVSNEIELAQAEVEELKKAGDKDIDDIKTLMEEVDMRISETKKDTYEFKRDIIIGAENPRTGKIAGEKMIRCDTEPGVDTHVACHTHTSQMGTGGTSYNFSY